MKSTSFYRNFLFATGKCLFIFLIVSFLLYVTQNIPQYAYPIYLSQNGSLVEFIHSIAFYGLVFLFSIFVYCVYFFRLDKRFVCLFKKQLQLFSTSLKDNKNTWLMNLLGLLGLIPLSLLLEFLYGTLFSKTLNSTGELFNQYRFYFFLFLLFTIFFLYRFRKTLCQKPEKAFLLISLLSGILLASSLPTTAVVSWDDEIHYTRAVELLGIGQTHKSQADMFILGHSYPPSFNLQENYQMEHILNQAQKTGTPTIDDRKYGKSYLYLAYIPSAIGIGIGRILSLSFSSTFVLGRVFNLFAYSLLMYYAIKKLKSGKLILMTIGLFPTCIFLASNYSYDMWVMGFCALSFSYLFYHLQTPEEPLSLKDALIMVLSLLIGLSAKAIYFPLILLLLFIRKEKFQNPKHYRYFVTSIIITLLIVAGSFLLPLLFQGPSTDHRGGTDVNAPAQLAYIFSHPLQYTKTLLQFLKGYVSVENTAEFTSFLSYYGFGPHTALTLLILFVTVFLDRNTFVSYTTTKFFRISTGFICFVTLCFVSTALYLAYTPVALNTILGCQPRYILPIIFPFLYIIGGRTSTNYYNRNAHYYITYGILSFILFSTIWNLVSKLYH